jgi:hypothetical protein
LEASAFGSGYGYEDEREDIRVALFYKEEFETGRFSAKETPILNQAVKRELAEILERDSARRIKRVVNFGACYAHIDAQLARRHPEVDFVGLDRASAVRDLNMLDFGSVPNLSFVSADILEWIDAQETMEGTLFFSVRTQVLLPREFLRTMYASLSAKGCSRISLFEPYGLSRQTNNLEVSADELSVSHLYRDTMFIHNYRGIGLEQGFHIENHSFLKTPPMSMRFTESKSYTSPEARGVTHTSSMTIL